MYMYTYILYIYIYIYLILQVWPPVKREIGLGSVAVRCIASAMRYDYDALQCDAKLCTCAERTDFCGWCFEWALPCHAVPWPCHSCAVAMP